METILLTSATSLVKWAATYHAKELVVQLIIFLAALLILRNLALRLINLLTKFFVDFSKSKDLFIGEVRETKNIFERHTADMVSEMKKLEKTIDKSINELKRSLVTIEFNHAKSIKNLDDRVKTIEDRVLGPKH
jgi:hypothetical protein